MNKSIETYIKRTKALIELATQPDFEAQASTVLAVLIDDMEQHIVTIESLIADAKIRLASIEFAESKISIPLDII